MHSVLVLDLDGTTAPIGRPASARTVKLLKKLERKGYRIVFSSGKPAFYLCGFVLFMKHVMNSSIAKREEKAALKAKAAAEQDAANGKGGDQA